MLVHEKCKVLHTAVPPTHCVKSTSDHIRGTKSVLVFPTACDSFALQTRVSHVYKWLPTGSGMVGLREH